MKNKAVRLPEKLGFLTFSTSSNIVYNFKSLYYLIFLTNVLKIPVLTAGTILTIGTVWDAVNDPLIGVWTANYRFTNGERVRPWIIWAAVPWAATVVLLFTKFTLPAPVTIAVCLVVYFIYETVNTVINVPYNAMANLASNEDADRRSINAYRSLGGCLGSGIGAVAVTPIVKAFGGLQGKGAIIGEGDAKALLLTALTMAAICILGCVVHYFTTKERVQPIAEATEEKVSLTEAYRILFRCKSWVQNMGYITTYGVLNTLIMTCINYYAAYIMGSSSAATPILAVYLLVSVAVSVLTPAIDAALGRNKTMLAAAAVLVLGKIPFVLAPYSVLCIYINAVTVGIGSTVAFVMFNTNRNNISDIVELQSGRRLDSMIASGDNLASKFAVAIVTQLIAVALSVAGFDEALKLNQTPGTLNTICALLGWVPALVAALMFAVVYTLDPKKEMDAELAKRAQGLYNR